MTHFFPEYKLKYLRTESSALSVPVYEICDKDAHREELESYLQYCRDQQAGLVVWKKHFNISQNSEEIVEREAGVHIRRLGYFFIWKIPRKMTYNTQVKGKELEENYNHHTNHHMYSPIFLPSLDSNNTLQYWSMDNSFCKNVKHGVRDKINDGVNYKMYPFSLSNLNRK